MDSVVGERSLTTPAHLQRHSHHFVPHHGPEIIHGHEAYKELIFVLVLVHLLLVAVLYWLYSTAQRQKTGRRQASFRMQEVKKTRQMMTAKLGMV